MFSVYKERTEEELARSMMGIKKMNGGRVVRCVRTLGALEWSGRIETFLKDRSRTKIICSSI